MNHFAKQVLWNFLNHITFESLKIEMNQNLCSLNVIAVYNNNLLRDLTLNVSCFAMDCLSAIIVMVIYSHMN